MLFRLSRDFGNQCPKRCEAPSELLLLEPTKLVMDVVDMASTCA